MVAMKGVIPHHTAVYGCAPGASWGVSAGGSNHGQTPAYGWAAWLWIVLFALVDGTLGFQQED